MKSIILITFFVLSQVLISCQSQADMKVIVPDSYYGPVLIYFVEEVDHCSNGFYENGLVVPKSGVIKLNCSFSTSGVLEIELGNSEVKQRESSLRQLGTKLIDSRFSGSQTCHKTNTTIQYMNFIVGTQDSLMSYKSRLGSLKKKTMGKYCK